MLEMKDGSPIEVSISNGFKLTEALPVVRKFLRGRDYIRLYGTTVISLEGVQTVVDDCVVMFDDFNTMTGYPVGQSSFDKYEIMNDSNGTNPGTATKRDTTIYLSKQFKEDTFRCSIWNGSVLESIPSDYLVANVSNEDYRVLKSNIFDISYKAI
jgi:hypothetical protein